MQENLSLPQLVVEWCQIHNYICHLPLLLFDIQFGLLPSCDIKQWVFHYGIGSYCNSYNINCTFTRQIDGDQLQGRKPGRANLQSHVRIKVTVNLCSSIKLFDCMCFVKCLSYNVHQVVYLFYVCGPYLNLIFFC